MTTIVALKVYSRSFRRIKNSNWVTPDLFTKKRWIKGVVTSVGDGDNFRLYHTPGIGWRWPLKFRRIPATSKALKDQTIHIRIAGVDAPEGAHFGRPAQPHSEESLIWLRNRITGRTLYCQVLQRDQYLRIVADVAIKRSFAPGPLLANSLAVEMLRAGCATVYEQAGAHYGVRGKEEFLKTESEARNARRGMWQKGTLGESPAEYKRRYAQLEAGKSLLEPQSLPHEPTSSKGWFSRFWRG
ncbi:SNase-domain-containing protein [Marasmius fiardii PR-910]|nr:SNase-domain-containing protein [Marasmius fiardii PR-910]